MEKFILIQRDFAVDEFHVHIIRAENSEQGWAIVEEKFSETNIESWLMTKEKAKLLMKKLTKVINVCT